MTKYLYRVDDITEDMNWENFNKYIYIFEKYNIKPLIGVVPNNKDEVLKFGHKNYDFYMHIKYLQDNNIVDIAQHGYEHLYESEGVNILKSKYGYSTKSEFAGLSYLQQLNKIKLGKEILERNGMKIKAFMAPGHTFDYITIMVLRELGIKNITDGIGITPYELEGVRFLPVQFGCPRNFPLGVITICLHINQSNDKDVEILEKHIIKNNGCIINFDDAIKIKVQT